MIFVVSSDLKSLEKVHSQTFINLNVWERQHIQSWITESPEMLGEELLVVTTEFDRFVGSSDRLDVLALDRKGNLVIIELKRDSLAAYADLQSLRYAAMVSAMTIEKLLPYYTAYQRKKLGESLVTEENAREQIMEFVDSDTFEELSNRPRLILCSEDFSQEITTTVLWLRQFGVDISCVKITPHKLDDRVVIVPTRIIPLQEASNYVIDIQQKEEKRQEQTSKRQRTMSLLIDGGLLKAGDTIYLKNSLPSYLEYSDEDTTYRATITGKLGQKNAVRWEKDGQEYAISRLTWLIFRDLDPEHRTPGAINGNWHWVNTDGVPLWNLAQDDMLKNPQ